MKEHQYPALGETVLWDRLENGLPIAVIRRPGFTKKQAYFAVNFGALDTEFTLDGQRVSAPAGVAHYLEHKLFDMPDGRDITQEFARLGAYPNAFTSFSMTAYHFSCTENFAPCLKLLLEFVSTPWFTEQSVEKERGIIAQEIGMNTDSPDARVFDNLMTGTYRNHPIRVPILGSLESIARITPQVLYQCHRAFYHPENMLLCVIGDVDICEVKAIAQAQLGKQTPPEVMLHRDWQEQMHCEKEKLFQEMEVAMPTFMVGFKCEPLPMDAGLLTGEVVGELAAEVLFGEASSLYLQLYEEGLIDSSFGGGFDSLEEMAQLTAGGDSEDPERVCEAILQQARRIVREGICEEDFLRLKRSAIGRRIRGLDRFDSVCFRICAYNFCKADYLDFPKAYEAVTVDDIYEFLERVVTKDRMCLCVIGPRQEA